MLVEEQSRVLSPTTFNQRAIVVKRSRREQLTTDGWLIVVGRIYSLVA